MVWIRLLGRATAVISLIWIACIKKVSSQLHGQGMVAELFSDIGWEVKRGDGTVEIIVSSERPCYWPCSAVQIV